VTTRHRLAAFLVEPLFELVPVLPGRLVIGLLGEDLDDVHDREEPRLSFLVVDAADSVSLKNGQVFFQSCWKAVLSFSVL